MGMLGWWEFSQAIKGKTLRVEGSQNQQLVALRLLVVFRDGEGSGVGAAKEVMVSTLMMGRMKDTRECIMDVWSQTADAR